MAEQRRLRWGILGTGNIANQFAAGVKASGRGTTVAVGSRARESAETFARPREIAAAYGSYDELLRDPHVDAVYNSLPNSLHHEWTIKAVRAGKHVLCEKPLASNVAEAREMFAAAREARRTLVEAFMYRSHPLTREVVEAVRGAIGELRMIRTSFCFRTTKVANNIRFQPHLAGGVLMDVGCYCVSWARLMAGGEPAAVHAVAHKHPNGVDDIAVGTLTFPSGVLASFTCGMSVQADNTAYVCGSEGYIEVPVPWKPPRLQAAYTIARSTPPRMDQAAPAAPAGPPPRETHHVDAPTELYGLEADDFAATVLDGTPAVVSEQDTIGNMTVLDELRRQVGVLS